jgi:hypothetical protein
VLCSTESPLESLLRSILPAEEPINSPWAVLLRSIMRETEVVIPAAMPGGMLPSAKEQALPVEQLRALLEYDPDSGLLKWKVRPDARPEWNTKYAGQTAGTTRDGAVQIRIENDGGAPFFLAHRVAWALYHGEWPDDLIDHEDGDPSNNRILNLRKASSSQNNCNRRVVTGASRFRGVYFHGQREKWAAQIKKDREWKWLGLHETEVGAAKAYDKAARELHGEFAVTNESLGLFRLREEDLRSYQRYLASEIEARPYLLGAAEMSLGKSAATLTGVRRLLRRNRNWRTLIVAPLKVAEETWPTEVHKWEHLKDLTYTVVTGDEKARLAALDVDADLTIINRENLQWLWRVIGGKTGWRWQILVYDESSRLKAWRLRTKGDKEKGKKANLTEFGVLASARSHIERVVELSGTPSPNGVKDLGGQAYLLDQGERLGRSRQAFLDRWFDQNRYTREVKAKPHAKSEIMALMKDVMIGLRAEDYIDLPPRLFNPIKVKLPPKIMKQYRDFKRTLVAEEYDVEAVSQGVLTNKLLQFANGGLYRQIEGTVPPQREVVHVHDYKLDALERIIEEAAGQSVLVAYSFKFDLARIKKRFPRAVVFDEEPNFVKRWNNRDIEIGLAHPASIGHGLNLQFGGHIQVWYGLTWSLELYDQFNRRLARPGQESPTVFIHHIIAEGTADEAVMLAMQMKGAEQDDITRAVRVLLTEDAAGFALI